MNAFRKITTKFRHRRPKGASKESTESHLGPGIRVAQGAVPAFPVERSANHEGVEQARQLNPPPINQSASPAGSKVLQDNVPDQPAQVPSAELKPRTDGETTGSTALQGTTLNQPARTHPSELRPKTDEIPVASGESIDMSKSATLPTEEGDLHMKKLWDDASKQLMDSIQQEISEEGVYKFFGMTIKFQRVHKQDDSEDQSTKYWIPILPLPTPQEVLQQLNAKSLSEDLRTDSEQTKNHTEKILGYLQPVGGLLAQVASAAFPPSQICFTAVCHALNTAQLYHEHFADLSALFERISYVLDRFHVHSQQKLPTVEPEDGMSRILRELLGCFVKICVVAARLSRNKKREKIKTAISLFVAGKDTEFKDLLQRIDDLSLAEMGFSIAKTLHSTQNIEAGVNTLVESNNKATNEKAWRKSIRDALHINDQELYWKTTCDTCLEDCADGTGDWLIADPLFQRWSSTEKIASPTITLEAPDSHGKTYLSARVIDTMQKKYRNTTGRARQHVAFYFCDKNQKNAKGDSVRSILASWLLQLTENNPAFLKFLADVCKEPTGLSQEPIKLWKDTFERYAKKKTSGATSTFFLILDGINHIDEHISKSFSTIAKMITNQKSDVLRVKLFLTGTTPVLDDVASSIRRAWVRITTSEKNTPDITSFINRKLDANKWPKNGRLERSRNTIVQDLLDRSKDFSILNGKLNKIKVLVSLEEIQKTIEEVSTVASAILKLDNKLDPESLEEFNEILPWIVLPEYWPSVRQIMAVLSLKRQEELDSSYEDHLLRKYPFPLLEISDGYVMSNDTLEHFRKSENCSALAPMSSLVEEVPKSPSHTTQLHPSEVLVIENIVRQACGPDLYGRFNFDEFFKSKRGLHTGPRILFNPIDGHMRIVVSCLKALGDGLHSDSDNPERSSNALHDYAIKRLPEHLKELASANLEGADSARKEDLGTHLYYMLTKEEYLKTWLFAGDKYDLSSLRELWLDDDSTVLNILKLFEDSFIRETMAVSERGKKEPLDTSVRSVLKEATAFMIRRWLQVEDWDIVPAFEWTRSYYVKHNEANPDLACKPEDIEEVVQWARKLIGSTESDKAELTRRAETMLYYLHYAEAQRYCNSALDADPTYWRASWCSIRTLHASNQPDGYKHAMLPLRNLLRDVQRDIPSFSTTYKETWGNMLKQAETYSETLDDPKEAIDDCRELLKIAPHAYNAMRILIKLLSDTKQYVAVTDYLKDLSKTSDEEGHNSLAKLLHYCSESYDLHHQIAFAVKTHSDGTHISELTQMIDSAFKEACTLTASDEICERMYIRYYHGLVLYYSIPDGGSILRAIDLWQSNVSEPDPSGGTSIDWIRSRSARKLTEALLTVCKNSNWDCDSVEECLNRFKRLQEGRKEILGKQEDLLVARICQESEHRKADVKEWVKEYVRQALVFLEDQDKGNDWYGYQLLAEVLLPIDQENALAAWMKIGPHDRAHDTSSAPDGADDSDALSRSSSDSDDSDDPHRYGPLNYVCDGECGHTWTYATDMYWCRECVDVAFDEKCLKKLQAQELSWRVCRHDHDFVHVPSWDGNAAKAVDADHIQVGNEEPILVKDWVARLEHLYCEDDGGRQDEGTQKNTQVPK